jgi:hypothetical protein
MKSNTTALTTSGFNTLIIFGIGVLDNGNIEYFSNTPGSSDALVASNGTYVGGDALAAKVRSLKTPASGTSSVTRLEISMNSQHIRDLVSSTSTSKLDNSTLAHNFAALKTAWALDAVNNDDESIYDASSTVTFARMLGRLGYRYTIAPYTFPSFWAGVTKQLNQGIDSDSAAGPNLMDRVYLQCYDGGASNDPAEWKRDLGMDVVPLLWVTNDSKPGQGSTVAQARTRFAGWEKRGGLAGGGYWNDFDIEKMGLSYKQYEGVLTDIFS